ncbi:MAG: aromatic-ring-hydroxylating dioxygenase subunit beta [Solirubrobacterales bacterium]
MRGHAAVSLETRLAVQDFLVAEAEALDDRRFEEWLALFAEDATYYAPVKVTRRSGNPDVVDEIGLFDENKKSLGLRVKRLATDVAWAEDPPSHTRRFVTNIRIAVEGEELSVRSNLMLFRSRGDHGAFDLIACERTDRLRPDGEGSFEIAARLVSVDQASLGTKNLGIFL